MAGTLYITGDPDADALINSDGTALLIGMLLDQQVPMEVAFRGPSTLRARLGHLDAKTIAAMELDDFVAVCCAKPAIHRYCGAMGKRVHALCAVLTERYNGRGERVWDGVKSADELYRRLRELPGYGDEKSRIFIAIIGKRMGVRPRGWRGAAGKFGEATPRSVADSTSPATLAKVREWKRAQKAALLDKQDRPLKSRSRPPAVRWPIV
jgi:uncharacterized HhH-GPD family protein